MKLLPLAALLLSLVSCRPSADSPTPPPPAARASAGETPSGAGIQPEAVEVDRADAPPAVASSAAFSPRAFDSTTGGISFEGVAFHAGTHRLSVADQAAGPGSQWADARAAGAGGLAAINASFFNPDGSPLGLVVTGGSRRGSINRASSLGAGFFVESSSGELRLVRREHFQGGREAVQAGPFLVENGRAVGGLSDAGSSARSFIATDGRGGWVMARTGPGSLAALGQALQNAELGGVKIRSALNLDGGRSSEIWVSDQVAGGPRFTRPFWNSSVRNYLVLRKR